jgi:hypothetical protein
MVTRIHKSPKPYVFAVKSTDSLSFFENSADYVHVFCCSEKDGQKWLENVLLARVSDPSPPDDKVTSQQVPYGYSPTLSTRNVTRLQLGLPPALAEYQANPFRVRPRARDRAPLRSRWFQLLPQWQQIPLRGTPLNPGRCWPSDDRYVPIFYLSVLSTSTPLFQTALLYFPHSLLRLLRCRVFTHYYVPSLKPVSSP